MRREPQSKPTGRTQTPQGSFSKPSPPPDLKDQLSAIVEFSNDAIFSRTFDGTILTWNSAAERMFGYTSGEMIGRSSRILLPRRRREEYRELVARIQAGQRVQHFETDRICKDGKLVQVSLALSPICNAEGRLVGIATIARDITDQRQVREALARSERELADLFEEASVGLIWISPKGLILRANRALLALLQCRPAHCLGRSLTTFFPDGAMLNDLLDSLSARQTVRNVTTDFRTTKGEAKPVLVDANSFWEHGQFAHSRWFVRDISQRKRLEREILELSDRERRSFAHELHDGLGQELGGIAYLTNVLHEQLLESRAPEAADAGRISELVRNTIELTRQLARGLSPISSDPEGLADALGELALQTREVFKVACAFHCFRPVLVVDSDVAGHFYRIAQEAVNNALKHGQARRIDIQLSNLERHLQLIVRDDGTGIGPLPPRRSGLGLRIMQYRADLVRGRLWVRPAKRGRGTEVKFTAPLPRAKPSRAPKRKGV
jgi:PAS domain S-box-containing protein